MPTRKKRNNQETSLSRAIDQTLTAKGCVVWRIQAGILPVKKGATVHFVHCAPNGSPDLLVIKLNRHTTPDYVHIEVKTKTGKLSPDQVKFHLWAQDNNVRSVVARSITEAVQGVFGRDDAARLGA